MPSVDAWVNNLLDLQSKQVNMFPPSVTRDIWSALRGHSPVWEEVWPPAGPPAGGAVCGLHQGEGLGRGGSLSDARTGQPGQRAAGVLRLWRQASVWQVVIKVHQNFEHLKGQYVVSEINQTCISISKLFSKEIKVPRTLFEARKVAGPPHINKVKQYKMLCLLLRSVCLLS